VEVAFAGVVKIPVFGVSGRVMVVLRIPIGASVAITSRTVRLDGSRNWVVKVEGASSLLVISARTDHIYLIRVAHLDLHRLTADKGNNMLVIFGRCQ
jgi:hypothetical protein